MFYNRSAELEVLRNAIGSSRGEMAIVYGRRGVGKTALLREAVRGAPGHVIFYRATRRTLSMQLDTITQAVRSAFPDDFIPQSFETTDVFLRFVAHKAAQAAPHGASEPIVLVIDELPYLAAEDPGFLTSLQHWWDDHKRLATIKVFMTGSYVAFMERSVLDVNAPLYNRRTCSLRLMPMDYAEAALFFPGYSLEHRLLVYAILGGMPSYLEQFDPNESIERNVVGTVFRQNTYLSEEPDWLLMEDLRRDAVYGSILRAVATGNRKPSDIARAIGRQSAQDVSSQLATMQELGLLDREVPVTERRNARSRKSLYSIADNYLDFWFRYVDPARGAISRGMGAEIWQRTVQPALNAYASRPAFERACRQCLWRALSAGTLGDLRFVEVGSWWGAGDREIDVVALDQSGKVVLVGSCKWTTAQADVGDYAALQRDAAIAGFAAEDLRLALFSRNGFTDRIRALADAQETGRLLLVDLPTMFSV